VSNPDEMNMTALGFDNTMMDYRDNKGRRKSNKISDQIELINAPENLLNGSDSQVNTEEEEKQEILPKNRGNKRHQVGETEILEIIERSLTSNYNVSLDKFHVNRLINFKGKVRSDLLKRLESKLGHQLNSTIKLKPQQVVLDFGPYPMPVNWQQQDANKKEQKKQDLYLPPDEDNFEKHGVNNLVIKFSDDEPLI